MPPPTYLRQRNVSVASGGGPGLYNVTFGQAASSTEGEREVFVIMEGALNYGGGPIGGPTLSMVGWDYLGANLAEYRIPDVPGGTWYSAWVAMFTRLAPAAGGGGPYLLTSDNPWASLFALGSQRSCYVFEGPGSVGPAFMGAEGQTAGLWSAAGDAPYGQGVLYAMFSRSGSSLTSKFEWLLDGPYKFGHQTLNLGRTTSSGQWTGYRKDETVSTSVMRYKMEAGGWAQAGADGSFSGGSGAGPVPVTSVGPVGPARTALHFRGLAGLNAPGVTITDARLRFRASATTNTVNARVAFEAAPDGRSFTADILDRNSAAEVNAIVPTGADVAWVDAGPMSTSFEESPSLLAPLTEMIGNGWSESDDVVVLIDAQPGSESMLMQAGTGFTNASALLGPELVVTVEHNVSAFSTDWPQIQNRTHQLAAPGVAATYPYAAMGVVLGYVPPVPPGGVYFDGFFIGDSAIGV